MSPEDYDLYLGGISRSYHTFLSLSGEKDIDRALAGKGKFIVCNPMIAIQSDGFSDNTLQFRHNSLYFKKRKLWRGENS